MKTENTKLDKWLINNLRTLYSKLGITGSSVIVILFLILFIWVTSHQYWGLIDLSDKNNIGDALGGITAPFIGLISIVLMFLAFYIQYVFNKRQFDFNTKQFEYIKKQNINESINHFNHSFEIVSKVGQNIDSIAFIYMNNSCLDFLKYYSENKAESVLLLKSNESFLINYLIKFYNFKTKELVQDNPHFGFYSLSIRNFVTKFCVFLEFLRLDLNKLELDDSSKQEIIYNYILKSKIVSAPEIINYLAIEILTGPFIKEKNIFIDILSKDNFLDRRVFELYEDIK